MFDSQDRDDQQADTEPDVACSLCILGAGIAGLNALYAATRLLAPGERVVLVDRRSGPGGMWRTAYEYVRLHQPHPMFTVGDTPWDWDRPRYHLARGAEVTDHLTHCLDQLRGQVDLVEMFGTEAEAVEEVAGPDGVTARLRCRTGDGSGRRVTIQARRLIDARGLDVPRLPPLRFASTRVRSVTPETLRPAELRPGAQVYVVGGGKTGMDTVLSLLGTVPGVRVTLINGQGTVFGDRDRFVPRGLSRWWRGRLVLNTFADLALRFDGRNEAQVFEYFRDTCTISPTGGGAQFLFGMMSRAERDRITNGLHRVHGSYLDDVIDGDAGPRMVFRDGRQEPVPAGAVFVNCTGHLLKTQRPYTPYLSSGGAILTITTRSAVHFLSTVSAYFLAHLFLMGRLRDLPLWELDLDALIGQGRKLWHLTVVTHSLHNAIVMMEALPMTALNRCGLDLDRWYPLPRRLIAIAWLRWRRNRILSHCRSTMKRVRARSAVRCGPLD